MEDNKTQKPATRKKSNQIFYIIALIVVVLVAAGLAYWLFTTKSDLKELKDEKEQIRIAMEAEIDSLLQEHEVVKEKYGELADSLSKKDSVIKANAREIKRLLNTQWNYVKLKKKHERLQEIAQNYVHQMDSLYTLSDSLRKENVKITKKYESQLAKTSELEKVKEQLTEKVSMAETLQTYNLSAEGIRLRWGGEKEKETDRARRVDQIKICFTLSENPILPHGNKELYIRIAQPDKLILTPSRGEDYSFMYQGERLQYSIMKEVNYQGNAMDFCVYWKKRSEDQEMMEGTYHVEIFYKDEVIGHTTFSLR